MPGLPAPGSQTTGFPPNRAIDSAHLPRLADLREWHAIEIACPRCQHVGRWRPKPLMAHLMRQGRASLAGRRAADFRLSELEHRFACRDCGNRAGNVARVVMLERNV